MRHHGISVHGVEIERCSLEKLVDLIYDMFDLVFEMFPTLQVGAKRIALKPGFANLALHIISAIIEKCIASPNHLLWAR